MVLNKIWQNSKKTAQILKEGAVVLASPNAPIPKTDLHPRMMARPMTVGEWVRMSSWRHMWMYMPPLRLYIFGLIIMFTTVKLFFPSAPRQAIKDAEAAESHRKHERDRYYGLRQKANDKVYYEKYDPLRHTRPDAYKLVYGGGH